MTGPVTRFATGFSGKRSFRGNAESHSSGFLPAVAVLCLVLLAMLAVAQVAHLHPNQTDADHCQLCIVMHTVAPVAAAAAVIVIVQWELPRPRPSPSSVARQRQIRLFIRPPPVSC